MQEKTITVIIIHYNQSTILKETIKSLENQKGSLNFDIIIADDLSSNKEILNVQEIIKLSPLNIRLIVNKNKTTFNPSKTRNMAIKESSSDIIIILDGDIVPNDQFIKQHLEYHCMNNNILITTNRVHKDIKDLNKDIQPIDKDRTKKENDFKNILKPWRSALTFNISFTKTNDTFFDENFVGWGFEDTEFAYRMQNKHNFFVERSSIEVNHFDDSSTHKNPNKTLSIQDTLNFIRNGLYFLQKYNYNQEIIESVVPTISRFDYTNGNIIKSVYKELEEIKSPNNEIERLKELSIKLQKITV